MKLENSKKCFQKLKKYGAVFDGGQDARRGTIRL